MALLSRGAKRPEAPATASSDIVATLPAELRAAMAAVSTALDERANIDAAIIRNRGERAQAEVELEQVGEALAEVDVSAAVETDAAKRKALDAPLQTAIEARDAVAAKVARIARLEVALVDKARESDVRIRGDREILRLEMQAHAEQSLAILGAELREAAKPLIAVVAKIYGTTQALGIGGAAIRLFDEARIPSAVWGETAILAGSRYVNDQGETIDLAEAWRQAPAAAAIAQAMEPVRDLSRRIAGHVEYRDPPPAPKVHAQHTQGRPAIERARQQELENERLRAEAEAARPRAQPRSWTLPVGSI